MTANSSKDIRNSGIQRNSSRVEKDRKLNIMVAVMVRSSSSSISIFSSLDCLFPCDLVSLCLCIYCGGCRTHSPVQFLLLHPGHPHYAHQDFCLHWPHHLLWAEPPVPVWDEELDNFSWKDGGEDITGQTEKVGGIKDEVVEQVEQGKVTQRRVRTIFLDYIAFWCGSFLRFVYFISFNIEL